MKFSHFIWWRAQYIIFHFYLFLWWRTPYSVLKQLFPQHLMSNQKIHCPNYPSQSKTAEIFALFCKKSKLQSKADIHNEKFKV